MKSYLTDRQQKVKIDDVTSEYKEITTGVQQGTILGPLLFILYVNILLTLSYRMGPVGPTLFNML